MKNNIFKGYTKKILKSEAFISVMIVFVLAIGIIGTSYALYMDVDTDTNYEIVKVGDLSIGFDNGDNTILLENMTPMEDEYATNDNPDDGKPSIFSFYIYNTGTYTADYDLKLTTTTNNEVDAKYINYQLCKDNGQNCGKVKTLGDSETSLEYRVDKNNENIITSTIHKDELSPKKDNDVTNPSVYYFIKLWINNKYTNTDAKNKKIELRVIVDAKNASGYLDNKNTLAGKVLSNNNIKINNNTPNIDTIETESMGLYKTEDNEGISYYFRGSESNNYVELDNMCFRIIRIKGDGSTKLLLADTKKCNESMNNTGTIGEAKIEDINNILNEWFKNNITNENVIYTNYCNSNSSISALSCNDAFQTNISILTKDEVVFAGLNEKDVNLKTYITENYQDKTIALLNDLDNNLYGINNGKIVSVNNDETYIIRPVITLKNDTLANGNGTIESPYIIINN